MKILDVNKFSDVCGDYLEEKERRMGLFSDENKNSKEHKQSCEACFKIEHRGRYVTVSDSLIHCCKGAVAPFKGFGCVAGSQSISDKLIQKIILEEVIVNL